MTSKRPCLEAGCPNLSAYRGRCRAHAREQQRARGPRPYERKRYKLARERKLTRQPICEWEGCERLAEHAHHIEHLLHGGDPFAISNLMSLCAEHHAAIHRGEGGVLEPMLPTTARQHTARAR